MNLMIRIIFIGIGATLIMDIYSLILKIFNISSLDYRFLGRWIGNFFNNKFYHESILQAPVIKNELIIGWIAHYCIGITFSFLLWAFYGKSWFLNPTFTPAIIIGIATIIAPFLLMQPAFGFGIAGSNMPDPNILRFKSFMAHFVYGLGLFLSALAINYKQSLI